MRNPLERAFNTRFQGFPPTVEITYQVITGFVNQKPLGNEFSYRVGYDITVTVVLYSFPSQPRQANFGQFLRVTQILLVTGQSGKTVAATLLALKDGGITLN